MSNISPSLFTKKPVDESAVSSTLVKSPASMYPTAAFILILLASNWFAVIVQPPTFPPSNKTLEPVIWPLDFNIKLSFEELIWVDANSNPPIRPALAVIWPWASTKNSDADISPPSNLKIGTLLLPPVAWSNISLLFPRDIEACGEESVNPLALTLNWVTLILTSDPVIEKESFTNLIPPSASPILNSPDPDKNIPFPSVNVKLSLSSPSLITPPWEPLKIILPSPRLIEAWVEDISILVASNSNEPTFTVKSLPSNCILSPLELPTKSLPVPSM